MPPLVGLTPVLLLLLLLLLLCGVFHRFVVVVVVVLETWRSCPGPTIVNVYAIDSVSTMTHNAMYDPNMDW